MLSTKIKKVMVSIDNLKSVHIDDSLQKVVEVFSSNNVIEQRSDILLISNGNKVIDILSVGDILKVAKGLMKIYSHKEMKRIGSLSTYGQKILVTDLERQIETGVDLKVSDLKLLRSNSLNPEDSISTAFDLMLENNLRAFPVFDTKDTVIGIVRDIDLLDCLLDFIES